MGLWRARAKMVSVEEKTEWAQIQLGEYNQEEIHRLIKEGQLEIRLPCIEARAPRMKERPFFEKEIKNELKKRKEEASVLERVNARTKKRKKEPDEKLEKPILNKNFISFWKSRTIEEEIEAKADNFDCENCPALKELRVKPDMEKDFSPCDFEGEKIAVDLIIAKNIRDRAYKNMEPSEMFEYADDIEKELEKLREEGYMNFLSEQELHPRERNMRNAAQWLRFWARHGVLKIS